MTDREKIHVAQLKKAAEIASVEIDALVPSGYMKLQADLYEFIHGAGIGQAMPIENLTDSELKNWELVPSAHVREIVKYLKRTLGGIADTEGGFTVVAELSKAELDVSATDKSSPFSAHWVAEPVQAAKIALLLHLVGSGLTADRVLRCPLPGCGNIFILASYARLDRMHYCHPRCARNAATKLFRARKMFKERRTLDDIALITGFDTEWLEKKLGAEKKTTRRSKVASRPRKVSKAAV